MEHDKGEIKALDGYRILDFGTAWAGPMAGQLLADMGAEVIKVESRKKMDGIRLGRPIIGKDIAGGDEGKWPNLQPVFHALNRNKLGITIDLKHPEGQGIIRELVGISDVVMDNSSPGVMEKLGLDHKSLKAVKSDIITLSLTACGESGPLRDVVAYAPSIAAIGGLNSLVGYRDDEIPYLMNVAYGDANASIHGALSVLAALWYREETGKGQHIELSETEAVASLLGEGFMEYFMNGRVPGIQGNYSSRMCPHGIYQCRGDQNWIAITVGTNDEWIALCTALEAQKWLIDERFADMEARFKNSEELDMLISELTRRYDSSEIMEVLQKAGVAATIAMTIGDQFADPHYRERKTFEEIEHPVVGAEMIYGIPWKLSRTPGKIERTAPSLGEHNDYVFGELLGYPIEEIRSLEKKKVLY